MAGRRGREARWAAWTLGLAALAWAESAPCAAPELSADVLTLPPLVRWRSYTTADGLPSDKVLCVRADGERVWAGTEAGLACLEAGRWRTWGVKDGLPHAVVLGLDVSPRTGDLWIGTMGGLARLSGGRIDAFTQVSSGLSNDFVNDVECDPDDDHVWAASAMGASRLDLRTGEWTIFTEQNTPMAEPWTYSAAVDRGLVYIGAWGAGVLEYEKRSGRWREYRDPDKEMEIDLLPDDGPVHDVTAGIDFEDGVLWQASYFGLARYDGRSWRTYFKKDSGLANDFVQFVRARGRTAWCCTDDGLSTTDGSGWVTYRRREDGKCEVTFARGKDHLGSIVTETALAHNFVLGADVQGERVWAATEKGLSAGEPDPAAPAPPLLAETTPGAEAKPQAPARADAAAVAARFHYASTPDELLPYRHLKIYHELFTTPPQFLGAGREKPEPEVEEVRIGFIAPLEDEDEPILPPGFRSGIQGDPKAELFGRPMLRGAILALDDANREGGYRGKPFRLVRRTDLVQWGQTSNELAQFAYSDGVWAVLSGIDSNHQHVLARATLKAEVPIVNAGSTDPTLLEHTIPWIVRVMSDDRQSSYALLDYVLRVRGLSRIAVLRVNDRDGRVGIMELVQGARRLNHPIVIEQRFRNGDRDFSEQLDRIAGAGPDALYLLGNPIELGLIVKAACERGVKLPIFAADRATHPKFLETAGSAAEGVVAAATFNPERLDAAWTSFRERYAARFGEEPHAFSAHAYDGTRLIVEAIRSAGLNRARIRDALFARKTFDGVTGEIAFDSTVNNVRKPWLAEVREGRFRYFRPPPRGQEGD
ncbi:MAG: ABC transporter substrate-binding protein [Planctomycetes bacterium]|nr:ABC transporter substrate-binding protein [Planctomycetota bacterium]